MQTKDACTFQLKTLGPGDKETLSKALQKRICQAQLADCVTLALSTQDSWSRPFCHLPDSRASQRGTPQSSQTCSLNLQVEIKLRLPNKEAHAQVAEVLKGAYRETHEQENFFFDGSNNELTEAKLALRVRFYGVDKKAVVSLKVSTHACQMVADLFAS